MKRSYDCENCGIQLVTNSRFSSEIHLIPSVYFHPILGGVSSPLSSLLKPPLAVDISGPTIQHPLTEMNNILTLTLSQLIKLTAVENVDISVRLLVNLSQVGGLGVLQLEVAHLPDLLVSSWARGLDFDREREVYSELY